MASKNQFKAVGIDALLDNMLLQRDVFRQNVDIDVWKSAYVGIYGLSTLVHNHIQQKTWRGTEIETSLKQIQRTTNHFIRQIRKKGKIHGMWTGSSELCCELLHAYQTQCIPMIHSLVETLDEDHPLRKDIEEKHPQYVF